MPTTQDVEAWALQQAEKIVLGEGMKLMEAAQWLDRKKTVKASAQLRHAICQSLIEAMSRADLPIINADNDRFDREVDLKTEVLDQTLASAGKALYDATPSGRLPALLKFRGSASG